jgi:hypothetical protein
MGMAFPGAKTPRFVQFIHIDAENRPYFVKNQSGIFPDPMV